MQDADASGTQARGGLSEHHGVADQHADGWVEFLALPFEAAESFADCPATLSGRLAVDGRLGRVNEPDTIALHPAEGSGLVGEVEACFLTVQSACHPAVEVVR